MNLKNFFSATKNITAFEARSLIESKKQGDFHLLDVRQPKEYQAGHLPGSELIPLKELPARAGELDRNKPVIVYCAVGGRSKVAAQFLAGLDFPEVYNMTGGMKAWKGHQAFEDEEYGLELLIGTEDFPEAVSLAYNMEDGLQKFYQTLADRAVDGPLKNLYLRLSSFEEKHKQKLRQAYQDLYQANSSQDTDRLMEGGYNINELIARTESANRTEIEIIEMAMMLETQALDLYSRLARKSKGNSQKLFYDLADEEHAHLSYLTEKFDHLLNSHN